MESATGTSLICASAPAKKRLLLLFTQQKTVPSLSHTHSVTTIHLCGQCRADLPPLLFSCCVSIWLGVWAEMDESAGRESGRVRAGGGRTPFCRGVCEGLHQPHVRTWLRKVQRRVVIVISHCRRRFFFFFFCSVPVIILILILILIIFTLIVVFFVLICIISVGILTISVCTNTSSSACSSPHTLLRLDHTYIIIYIYTHTHISLV